MGLARCRVQKRIDDVGSPDEAGARSVLLPRTGAAHELESAAARALRPGASRAIAIRREWLWVLSFCAVFAVLSTRRAFDHPYPFYDDVAYLDLGNRVRDLGGPVRLVGELFAGRFTEVLRNPLYPALLSVIAGRDPGYHRRAQVLAVGLGVGALLCCWRAARRLLGRRAALATLALLSINSTLVEQAARESVETMLLGLWALSFTATVEGERRPARWLWAGALCGLAYLCKGTGLFLLCCVAMAVVAERGFRALCDRGLWSYLLGFVVAASPLLVRNVRTHGWPSHNSEERVRLLWAEPLPDYAEIFAPNVDARLPSSLLDYLKNTSASQLAARLGRGALETTVALGESLSFNPPNLYGPLHMALIAIGLAAVLVGIALAWRSRRGLPRTLLLLQTAWFFAFFVLWNGQGVLSRYFLPVASGLAGVLGAAVVSRAAMLGRWRVGWLRSSSALVVTSGAIALLFDRSPTAPTRGFVETQTWILEHVPPGEGYAVDSRSHLEPRWLVAPSVRQLAVSSAWQGRPVPAEELVAWLRKHEIRHVVLDASSHADRLAPLRQCEVPYLILDRRCREKARARHQLDRRYLFYDRVPLDREGRFLLTGFPSGLHLAYVSLGRRWVILKIEPER